MVSCHVLVYLVLGLSMLKFIFLGKKQLSYLYDDTLDAKYAKFAEWGVEDTQIRIQLWNSMEPQISGFLVYL